MISGREVEGFFRGKRKFIPNPIYMHIEKKRRGFEYYQILVLLKNVPGNITEMTKYLETKGYNVIAMRSYVLDEVTVLTYYLEVAETSHASAEMLRNDLSKIKNLLNVKVVKMTKTGQFDAFHFPLVFKDTRMLAVTDEVFYSLRKQLLDTLESGGAVMLYNTGLKAGSTLFNQLLSETEDIEDQLLTIQDIFRAFGWGIVEIKGFTLTSREGEIIIEENLEAKELDRFKCHFTRGVLTGLIRRILEDDSIRMDETHCKSMGDDYCRFVMS